MEGFLKCSAGYVRMDDIRAIRRLGEGSRIRIGDDLIMECDESPEELMGDEQDDNDDPMTAFSLLAEAICARAQTLGIPVGLKESQAEEAVRLFPLITAMVGTNRKAVGLLEEARTRMLGLPNTARICASIREFLEDNGKEKA